MTRPALALVVAAMLAAHAQAANLITVTLASGRTFTAHVSPRTDDQRLWLQFGSEGAKLLRPVTWDRVVAGVHAGASLSAEEVKAKAMSLRSVEPAPAPSLPALPGMDVAESAIHALDFRPRVRSITCDMHLANWDADAAADGLLIHVYPRDAAGRLVAVSGAVEVELTGSIRREFDQRPGGRGRQIARIGRWVFRVTPHHFGPNGAVVRAAFQNADPSSNEDIGLYGLVNVKLAAPGHGVFEHPQDMVRIQPPHLLRQAR